MSKLLKQLFRIVFTCFFFRKEAFSEFYCNSDGNNDKASIFRRFITKLKGNLRLDFTKAAISETFEIPLMPADEARKLDPTLSSKMQNNNCQHYAHPLEMSYFDHKYPMSVDPVAPAMPELAMLKHVCNELSDVPDHQVSGNDLSSSQVKDANLPSSRKKWFIEPPPIVQNVVDLPNWAKREGGTKFVNETAFPELREFTLIIKRLISRNVQSTPVEITQSACKKWFLEPVTVNSQVELPNWGREKINLDTANQLVSDQVLDAVLFIQQNPKLTFRAKPVSPTIYKPDLPVLMIKGRQSFKNTAQ